MRFFSAITLLWFVSLSSCGAHRPPQTDDRSGSTLHFDVDINGSYVVADALRNTLRLYAQDGRLVAEVGGSGWGDGQFDKPAGVWSRNGIDVFVADYGNHRVQRFDRKLAFISSYSTRDRQNPDERFGYPTAVAVSRLGDLFVCDGENSRILKLSGIGKFERTFGGYDAGKGRLRKPVAISIGPADNLYVQDEGRIVVFDNFGNYLRIAAENVLLSSADENGLVIIEGERIRVFDKDDRLKRTTILSDVNITEPLALTVNRGSIFILTENGIVTVKE